MRHKLERLNRTSSVQYLIGEQVVLEAASLLSMARSNVDFDDAAINTISSRLAAVAERCKLSPEEVTCALYLLEPELGREWDEMPPAQTSY